MSFRPDHELHRRRLGRNVGLGLVLAGFAALMFALTIVKVGQGDRLHMNDGKRNTGVFIDPAAPETQPKAGGGTSP